MWHVNETTTTTSIKHSNVKNVFKREAIVKRLTDALDYYHKQLARSMEVYEQFQQIIEPQRKEVELFISGVKEDTYPILPLLKEEYDRVKFKHKAEQADLYHKTVERENRLYSLQHPFLYRVFGLAFAKQHKFSAHIDEEQVIHQACRNVEARLAIDHTNKFFEVTASIVCELREGISYSSESDTSNALTFDAQSYFIFQDKVCVAWVQARYSNNDLTPVEYPHKEETAYNHIAQSLSSIHPDSELVVLDDTIVALLTAYENAIKTEVNTNDES